MTKFNECAKSLSTRTDTQLELNLEILVHGQFILFSVLHFVILNDDIKNRPAEKMIPVSEMFTWNIIISLTNKNKHLGTRTA